VSESQQRDEVFTTGARSLLARATESYGLNDRELAPRIKLAVEKYLLRDDPDTRGEAITEFIEQLQADDLCLIVACEHGNQSAWTDLVERFTPAVRSAARSASSNEQGAEDLAQSIWAELHGTRVREDGRPAGKLAYYSGRGSLAGWLRAVVAQLAVDQHRKQARLVQPEDDGDFDRLVQHRQDDANWSAHAEVPTPEQQIATKLASAQMQKALADSVSALAAEDRLLVKLYYFDGLRLRQAGAVLGVHEATASRRLARVHSQLREQVQAKLINSGWTVAETERAFAEVAPGLETDIQPLLANDRVTVKKENEVAG